MWHVQVRGEICAGFAGENWNRAFARPRHKWGTLLKLNLKKWYQWEWTD
jgi:hypothetical protein